MAPNKKEAVKNSGGIPDIEVKVDTVSLNGEDLLLNINFFPPQTGPSPPTVFVAVLDVSGSMDTEASVNNDKTGELQGYSRLDLVKHSMNTVVATLDE